jgi:hypothetical protein
VRLLLAICVSLLANGCASSPKALPVQPNAPTSEGIVATVGKQWDTADQKVAASVTIVREMADRPEVVRSEATVALSFLPPVEAGELAVARARAIKADPKEAADATAFGKKLLATINQNWAKVEADNKEALRVSQLKDARIAELTAEVERVKREASDNIWTLAGVGIAVIGAIATAFAGPKVGLPLLLSGAAIGAFPFVVDYEYFSYIAGGTLALAAGLGIYWLWDRVRDSANAPYEPPQK